MEDNFILTKNMMDIENFGDNDTELSLKTEQNEMINNINKKVVIREVRTKGKFRTNIYGLVELKIINNEEMNNFLKNLKKEFCCGCIFFDTVLESEDNKKEDSYVSLQGQHKVKIIEYLIKKYPSSNKYL